MGKPLTDKDILDFDLVKKYIKNFHNKIYIYSFLGSLAIVSFFILQI
jgi:hypothetical protein